MNTTDNWQTLAKVENPDRRAFWLATLGTDTVPIFSIIPTWATLPNIGESLVFLLDVHALSQEQQEKLLAALAEKFDVPSVEARELFFRDGVPILADDVEVTTTDQGLIANLVIDDDDPDYWGDQEDYPDVDDIWLEQMLKDGD